MGPSKRSQCRKKEWILRKERFTDNNNPPRASTQPDDVFHLKWNNRQQSHRPSVQEYTLVINNATKTYGNLNRLKSIHEGQPHKGSSTLSEEITFKPKSLDQPLEEHTLLIVDPIVEDDEHLNIQLKSNESAHYKKSSPWSEEIQSKAKPLDTTRRPNTDAETAKRNIHQADNAIKVEGRRIVDGDLMNQLFKMQWSHSKICSGLLEVANEKIIGFYSQMVAGCNKCFKMHEFSTSLDEKVNVGSVIGIITSAGTHQTLAAFCGVMDIPLINYGRYRQIEQSFFNDLDEELEDSMAAAASEERELAISKGEIGTDGSINVPVVGDGAWCKRSYSHSYIANSGVAVLIGQATGRILFHGTRNKKCRTHEYAEKLGIDVPPHNCVRNWSQASGGMEDSIILQGFNESVSKYGIKYKEFLGDGDSSVYSQIRRECPYGSEVEKVECANHAIKNFGKALYRIKDDKLVPLSARKLLRNDKLKQLQDVTQQTFARNVNGEVPTLKAELANVPLHVFGCHEQCKRLYCNKSGTVESYWKLVEATTLMVHVNKPIQRLISKAHQLIKNKTSNVVESFNSVLCKYNAGKRINFASSNSFHARSQLAALSFNEKQSWLKRFWHKTCSKPPGKYFLDYIRKSEDKLQYDRKRRAIIKQEAASAKKKCIK